MSEEQQTRTAPHVVIIGGGFGGLYAAKRLKNRPVRVTLIDRKNHHLFQPFLYQVATAALSPADIAAPIRSILRKQQNTRVLLAEASSVNLTAREVVCRDGDRITYDYLIIAAGARHSYFGHDEWEGLAPGLKSVEDALAIRRRVLLAFEMAEREPDPAVREALLTFVIVGGGPTGVELAGALIEISRYTMARDFRVIDPTQARVILLEAGPRILPTFPEPLSARATHDLTYLGVEVRANAAVTAIEPCAVVAAGQRIPTCTPLWAAGVSASPLARTLEVPLDRAGRILVEPDLTINGHPEVFVIGDLSSLTNPHTQRPYPGTAPVAIQQGRAAADNIWRAHQGLPLAPFRYRDHGNMAAIGRSRAIADFGRVTFTGFTAWLLWLFVHIYYLIGFEDRVLVMIQWAWSYLTLQRGARLITSESPSPQLVPVGLHEMQHGDGRAAVSAHAKDQARRGKLGRLTAEEASPASDGASTRLV
jgi:NADH dehydrogenase